MSGIGKVVNLSMDFGYHLLCFLIKNSLSSSFFTISNIGAVIHKLPAALLLLISLFLLVLNSVVLLEDILFIRVPRNFPLSLLVLVINVFSADSSKFRLESSCARVFFNLSAVARLPQNPISQSSAYLTYLIFMNSEFGISEFFFSSFFHSFEVVLFFFYIVDTFSLFF